MTTHPEDAMTRERALEEARQIADGLRLPPPNREHIARTLWESQRARIHNQDGINARLSWRDRSVPEAFWHHYELDADAVIAALASAQQEPAPAADAEEVADRRDAERWRAFLQSARIKIWGTAGFNDADQEDRGYRHFSGEFWTIYNGLSLEQQEQCTRGNAFAQRTLTRYADALLAARAKSGEKKVGK